jgi:hypothetical protein
MATYTVMLETTEEDCADALEAVRSTIKFAPSANYMVIGDDDSRVIVDAVQWIEARPQAVAWED